jgi:protein arginine N-methyltransferase 1
MPVRLRERAVGFLMRRVRPWLRSRAVVQRALYDGHNARGFSNLYEHEKMLADSVRVDAYRAAIARQVRPGDVVVDLGTGTGILAMLAARQGAERVYAIDHSPFIEVARAAAEANGIDTIVFEQVNSRSFAPPEKVDLVVHEQMGDSLFDENMVHNLLDLKRRVLREGGRILPARFELYVEPVVLEDDRRVPYLWENEIDGLDFGFARSTALDHYTTPGYRYRWILMDRSVAQFLTDPQPVLTFDLNDLEGEDELPSVLEEARPVTQAGTLDGFCVYFRAVFDDETSLTTSPIEPPTSWGTRVFRAPRTRYEVGDKLGYHMDMTDLANPGGWTIATTTAES